MTARYVLIRYRDSANAKRVGSGYIVGGSTVLTANHVADGTGHQIVCDSGAFDVDRAKTVLSETNKVDLGVLQLAGNPPQLPQLSFARVGREEMTIDDCTAVGFPRWIADEEVRQYLTKQIEGFIPTADQVCMDQDGGVDGQLLRLTIRWREGARRVPVPDGQLDQKPENPWGGMSGAAVTTLNAATLHPVVIGVVHSHNYARDPNVLTVTPLLALKKLDEVKQRQFCDALGIADINDLPMVTDREPPGTPGNAAASQPGRLVVSAWLEPAFSDGVQDNYQRKLESLGQQAPSSWDRATFQRLYRDCEQRVMLEGDNAEARAACAARDARDLAKALWLAAGALPLLSRFGGQYIGITKLRYLYDRHVGRWPECATLDGMLIDAASAGIREKYLAANDPGEPGRETVTALARFMLGIASHWNARQGHTRLVDLGEIKSWLREHLDLQIEDIDKYLDGIPRRTWVLIEFKPPQQNTGAPDSAARQMPAEILIQTVTDAGKVKPPKRVPCQATSERGVEKLLRGWFSTLDTSDFIVDLFLPRDWLGARVEQWKLLDDAAGSPESLSKRHDPRLRWSGHRRSPGADLLKARFASMQWMANPEDIPADVTSDPKRFDAWIMAREQSGKQDPPYFIVSSHGANGHDPLGRLLVEGHGFITWFTKEAAQHVRNVALNVANDCPGAWKRKDTLPCRLATDLWEHEPIIIWSDPDKREDFDLPLVKSRATTRGSVRK